MNEEKDAQKNILGLPKNIFLLGLVSLFNDFSSEMVFAVFPAFFVTVLTSGAASLGIVDGIAESLSNFFKIYSGTLSDRWQKRKPFLLGGYTLSVVTRPFYLLVSTVGGVLGLRVLDRIGKGMRDAPRDALISLSTSPATLGRSFGYHRMMDTLGSIVGPLVAYLILLRLPLHFNTVFITAFFIGILAVFTLFFVSDVILHAPTRHASLTHTYHQLSTHFKLFLLSIFILSMGSLPIAVILLKTQTIGLVIADIPLFYMIYNISYAAFSITAGKASDRVGAKTIIFIGYCILLISYGCLFIAHSALTLAASFFLLGLFPALTDGVQRSLTSQLAAEELRGGALGLLNAAVGFGVLFAGIIGGYLWQTYNPATAFTIASITVAVGLIVFVFSTLRRDDM